MGAEVTVVEMLDRIVPVEDADVSSLLEKSLKKQGLTILTGAGVEELKAGANGVSAKITTQDCKDAAGDYGHGVVHTGISPNPNEPRPADRQGTHTKRQPARHE